VLFIQSTEEVPAVPVITPHQLRRYDAAQGPRKLGPDDGKFVDLGPLGVRFMAWMEETGGGLSVVEHPIPPRTLAAPLHRHSREDEYSYVIEGEIGALLGDDTVHASRGDFVFKPREQWHTFWNPGDTQARLLEIIVPGGFEHYFDELAALQERPDFDPSILAEVAARYGLEVDPEGTARVCAEHGLEFPV
jgi:mannose-6-phosphate isomerase-like protein (cupin superfamily)